MKKKEMGKKKVIAAVFSMVFAASAVISVSASNLTPNSNESGVDVSAKIAGEDEPGNVSYIITIPDKLDFGTLAKPENDSTDNFKDVKFDIKATEVKGLPESGWYVRVKVKDQGYKIDDEERFFITQKTVSYPDVSKGGNKFEYSFYTGSGNDLNPITNNRKDENGFNVAFFNATGQTAGCQIRLNQNQLYNKDIKEIAGDYSGCVVFHSSIVNTDSITN